MMTRHLVVADVHGNFKALMKALELTNFNEYEDVMISLGDLIDRGRQTKECLEFFADLKDKGRDPFLIAGNHEIILMEALMSSNKNALTIDMWLSRDFGFMQTLWSYGFDPARINLGQEGPLRVDGKEVKTPADVEEFLLKIFGARHLDVIRHHQKFLYYKQLWDGVDAFMCHAGLTSGMRIGELSQRRLTMGDEQWMHRRKGDANQALGHPPNLVIIHGHWHNRRPAFADRAINLAIGNGVAILSCEEHLIATDAGEVIEVKPEWLGVKGA
jgi:calcineurin-like phosphoesterase family protein